MINIKNKLFYRKKRQPNNNVLRELYNKFRNRVNRELKKSKVEYYSQYFEDNNNNSKKLWEGIKSIINTKNSKLSNINQLKINDEILDNPKEIVEAFNDFFVNVAPCIDTPLINLLGHIISKFFSSHKLIILSINFAL